MKVEFFPSAEEELFDAAKYYEAKAAGLGIDLILEVERAAAVLIEMPSLGEKLDLLHRRVPLRRFRTASSFGAMEMSFASWP
jgi:hypothetical protein